MSRRRRPEKRVILPDPKFGDLVLSKFMNNLMLDGKKSVAERIVYGALETVEVKAKKMDAVYLLPGADFRSYTKVMIDPSEVAFKKNWLRDMNTPGPGSLDRRIDADDAKKIIDGTQMNFDEVFAETLTKNGYAVVTAPGPDVLRLSPGVANLYINAPQVNGPSMTKTYVMEAGEGTLVLEVRDSTTNALLGRVPGELLVALREALPLRVGHHGAVVDRHLVGAVYGV